MEKILYNISRIAWAKEALKSVIKDADSRFDDDTPFEEYPDYFWEASRDDGDDI